MTNLTIQLPETKYTFLKDDSVFQSVIIETIYDYIEKKEDIETRKNLSSNQDFHNINAKIEKKLGKL